MTRILVLGGTRYLGKSVVNHIKKDRRFEIATLSRSEETTDIKHFVCDRKNSCELKKIFENFSPNIILDMINFDKKDSQEISDLYEQECLSELHHYIMISSFFIYNHFDYKYFSEKKINENFNKAHIDGYTKYKIESELNLYSSKLMNITTILRLPFVFSADDYTNRFQRLCEISLKGSEMISNSPFKYSLLRKDDAAEAIVKIFNSNPFGIVDLSNVGYATNEKLVEALYECVALSENNRNEVEGSFPYFVNRDIYLRSQKMIIDLPIFEAVKNEAKKYWVSKS